MFELSATGTETVLYNFTGGSDGSTPWAGVIRDATGNLYGTATYGGGAGVGTAYKLDTAGNFSVLHTFTGGLNGSCFPSDDGCLPTAGLTRDSAGNLYGTTQYGGTGNCSESGCGIVFKLSKTGKEKVLYNFTGGTDGNEPSFGSLIRDASGNLYGTVLYGGGPPGAGVVYKLDGAGALTLLYTFTGGSDGNGPFSGLVRDHAGNLYGTTNSGGADGYGVAFKLALN